MTTPRFLRLIGIGLLTGFGAILATIGLPIEVAGPVVLLSVALSALGSELVALVAQARSSPRGGPPPGARPADGVVDVAPMARVESTPNRSDPRWARFESLVGPDPPRITARSAQAPSLLGRVALVSIFIGKDGRGWSDAEIARAHRSMERAGQWIEREAARHSAPANLELARVYFQVEDDADEAVELDFVPEGDDVGPMEANASVKYLALASRSAARLGFRDVGDLVGRIADRLEADALAWLLHLRQSGRSLAIPASDGAIEGVGLAICFARESSFLEPLVGPGRVDATTVVHELLHLFGASDKYGVGLGSFEGDTVGRRDIMRLEFDSLSKMTVDRLTASEIGWRSGQGGR